MGAETIAMLLVQFGLPFVDKLIQLWSNNTAVTPEVWEGLKKLVLTPENALAKVAALAGLEMTDPKVVELAGLIAARKA